MTDGVVSSDVIANPYQRNRIRKEEAELAELERGYMSADSGIYDPTPKQETKEEKPVEETNTILATPAEEELEEKEDVKYKKVDWKKRYSDLKRHYDKKVVEHKQQMANMSNNNSIHVPKSMEELEAFKAQHGELYNVIASVAHQSAEEKKAEIEANLSAMQRQLAEARQEKAIIELNTKIPDWQSITQSEDFQAWATEQPEEIQRWVFNNPDNASLAIKAIKLYKADRNIATNTTPSTKDRNAEAAASINVKAKASAPRGQKRVWTTSEIAALSLPEYDKLSKEIDKAYQEGRVVKG
jgi:hypothetical protein